MEEWMQIVVTIFCSIFASTGFWTYLHSRNGKHDKLTNLVLGLAHDRIMALGSVYITKGSITQDEYENLYKYLYSPYKANGGNGSAERLMREIDKLPIVAEH